LCGVFEETLNTNARKTLKATLFLIWLTIRTDDDKRKEIDASMEEEPVDRFKHEMATL
jgi:hypothetical protein